MEKSGVLVIRRSAAYLIDILLLFLVLAPIGLLIQWSLGQVPQTGPQIWGTLLWNFSIPAWLYFTLSDKSSTGATPGKRCWQRLETDPGQRLVSDPPPTVDHSFSCSNSVRETSSSRAC